MSQLDLPPPLALPDSDEEVEAPGADSQADGNPDPVALAVARPGGGDGPAQQIDLEGLHLAVRPDMARRPVYAQRSPELMEKARAVLAAKRSAERLRQSEESRAHAEGVLSLASHALPGVGALLGAQPPVVGRLRAPEPKHFVGLALAAHIPQRIPVKLGVKRKRLTQVVSHIIQERQERGMALLLANGKRLRRSPSEEGPARVLVGVYTHEWDETRSYFKRPPAGTLGVRQSQQGIHVETIVQRGSVRAFLGPGCESDDHQVCNEWLVPPKIVEGTKAADLHPAVRGGLPSAVDWEDSEALAQLCASMDCFVFAPIGDKASENVLIMKYWTHRYEADHAARCDHKVFFLPEVCQVHSHHRGKLGIQPLRRHTSRHYSINNLLRLPATQRALTTAIEAFLERNVRRVVVQTPPETETLMRVAVDILYNLDGDHHKRPNGKVSVHLQALGAGIAKTLISGFGRDARADGRQCEKPLTSQTAFGPSFEIFNLVGDCVRSFRRRCCHVFGG